MLHDYRSGSTRGIVCIMALQAFWEAEPSPAEEEAEVRELFAQPVEARMKQPIPCS